MGMVRLSDITVDPSIQPRESGVSDAHVEDIADAIRDGKPIPPLVAFRLPDGGGLLLAEGFHRIEAFRTEGKSMVSCDIKVGSRRDAALWAMGSNQNHGLKRTVADKRRAVAEVLLLEPTWSNRSIAKHCGVGDHLVAEIRDAREAQVRERAPDGQENVTTRLGGDGKQYTYPARRTPVAASELATTEQLQTETSEPIATAEIPEQVRVHAPEDEQPEQPRLRIFEAESSGPQAVNAEYGWPDWDKYFGQLQRHIDVLARGSGTKETLAHKGVQRCMESVLAAFKEWQKFVKSHKGADR